MYNPIIFLLLFFNILSFSKAADENLKLSYCVPVDKIDFNPFREIVDGKDLAYLMFLRSYISTDESEPGILVQYDFSPDGKIFTGRLVENLKWSTGERVTSLEAALGIAKTLTYRPLGKRVKILGSEKISEPGWYKRKYEGIEIVDARTFRLKFKTDIENLTGVLREAISTNSRHNRFWPIKISNEEISEFPEVLLKYNHSLSNGKIELLVKNEKIIFDRKKDCKDTDFSIFPETFPKKTKLVKLKSPNASAVTAQMNTNRLTKIERKYLISWMRFSFSGLADTFGVQEVESFFLPGESGFDSKIKWPSVNSLAIKNKKLVIAYEMPIYREILQKSANSNGFEIEFVELPTTRSDLDAQVLASGIIESRHVILQDALKWPHVSEFLQKSPKTRASLEKVAELSASTLPPDLATLRNFERSSIAEYSIAPVARRYPTAFSKPELSQCLAWSSKGELTFFSKNLCH